MNLKEIGIKAHDNAKAHGFYDPPPSVTERLCLIHSEVTEALESWRDDQMFTKLRAADGKPEGFPSEVADIIIRVCDMAVYLGINLDEEVRIKMAYNESRPYKHGRVNA